MERRLAIFKRRPATANITSDEYLSDLLNDAYSTFMGDCKRRNDHIEFDSAIVNIALILLNIEGIQGMSSASEGGMSRSKDANAISDIEGPYRLLMGER